MTAAVRALVTGRVQGVFYRQTCRHVARGLHLLGWVRNLPDGRVEVWAQGEEEAVSRLVEWLWLGPAEARVTGVESDVVSPDPNLGDFFIAQ